LSERNGNAWDDPDDLGRKHKRLFKISAEKLEKAMENEDLGAIDAWSLTVARHSKILLSVMEFKRQVVLDTGGRPRGGVFSEKLEQELREQKENELYDNMEEKKILSAGMIGHIHRRPQENTSSSSDS